MATFNRELQIERGSISYQKLAKRVGITYPTMHAWFTKQEMNDIQKGRVLKAIKEIQQKENK